MKLVRKFQISSLSNEKNYMKAVHIKRMNADLIKIQMHLLEGRVHSGHLSGMKMRTSSARDYFLITYHILWNA